MLGSSPIVRVGIVDDHRVILLGMTAMINGQPGLHAVAVGTTVAELVALRQKMDVILLDLTLGDGSTASQNIAALAWSGARILALAADEPTPTIRKAVRAGAVGVVRKSAEAAQIVAAVRAVARGESLAAADAVADFVDANLSAREAEVLSMYAAGHTAETVARELFVSRATVIDHIRRIRGKYASVGRPAPTKVDLFRRAVEDGLVPSGS